MSIEESQKTYIVQINRQNMSKELIYLDDFQNLFVNIQKVWKLNNIGKSLNKHLPVQYQK